MNGIYDLFAEYQEVQYIGKISFTSFFNCGFYLQYLFINVNYKIMNKIIINKPYSNIVLCLEVLGYMEEWNKLIGNCETTLDIPNCSDIID